MNGKRVTRLVLASLGASVLAAGLFAVHPIARAQDRSRQEGSTETDDHAATAGGTRGRDGYGSG